MTIVAAGWMVGLLSLANVRQRRQELGILRALGMRSNQVFRMLLAKPAVIGVVGSFAGYLLGLGAAHAAASVWRQSVVGDELTVRSLFQTDR